MLFFNAATIKREIIYEIILKHFYSKRYPSAGKYYVLFSAADGNNIIKYRDYCARFFHYSGCVLDSGAFTYLYSNKRNKVGKITKDEARKLIKNYAKLVDIIDPFYFFEMDLYFLGIDTVEDLRHELEDLTGRLVVPVWHKFLGVDYWYSLVERYPLISIGGVVPKEIDYKKDFVLVKNLVDYARSRRVHVHGLGVSPSKESALFVQQIAFSAIDSSYFHVGFGFLPSLCDFSTDNDSVRKINLKIFDFINKKRQRLFSGDVNDAVTVAMFCHVYKFLLDYSEFVAKKDEDEKFLDFLAQYNKRKK